MPEFETITIPALPDLVLAISTFLEGSNADQKSGKFTAAQLATFLAPYVTAVGGSGYVATTGTVLPQAAAGKYTIVGPGTYTQTTGGNVVTTQPINILASNASSWVLVTAIPLTLTDYVKKSDPTFKVYPTKEAAIADIGNVVVDGVNKRDGRIILIGSANNYVPYWWMNGFEDVNLVEFQSASNTVTFAKVPGYIVPSGDINSALGYNSGFVDVNGARYIQGSVNPGSVGSSLSIAFYDKNKIFISGVNTGGITQLATVPTNAFYAKIGGIDISTSAYVIYLLATSKTTSAITERLDAHLNTFVANIAFKNGYVDMSGSINALSSDWKNTGFYYISGAKKIRGYISNSPSIGSGYPVAFYDKNRTFISGANTGAVYYDLDIPVNAYYVILSGLASGVITLSVLDESNPKEYINESIESPARYFRDDLRAGYLSVNGDMVNVTGWFNTNFIYVKGEYKIEAKIGPTSPGGALSIAFYGKDKKFISGVNAGTEYDESLIPTAAYYAAVGGTSISYVKIIGNSYKNLDKDVSDYLTFLPDKFVLIKNSAETIYMPGLYSQGNNYKINSGIFSDKKTLYKKVALLDHNVDNSIFFAFDRSPFVVGAPVEFIDKASYSYTGGARSVMFIGDSLTQFDIWHQEFMRQLTGTGTPVNGQVTGVLAPMSLPLTAIGTRGGSVSGVKHEGRASWSVNTYLTQSSAFGSNNAFWNPSTSQFDINYYLTQNNFYTSLGGTVNATGGNLDIFIFLGWNDQGIKKAELTTLINLIKAKLPNVNIILVGLQTTPTSVPNYAFDRYKSVMDMVIQDSIDKQSVANSFTKVSFFPTAPYFIPDGSYNDIEKLVTVRDSEPTVYVNDWIHPKDKGLGLIADSNVAQYLSYLKQY